MTQKTSDPAMIENETPFDLGSGWNSILSKELSLSYTKDLHDFVSEQRKIFPVYPPEENVFEAFRLTPYEKVKVVIMGQDPYHGPGQAHGLSFSVPSGFPHPPSLRNIFKELFNDLGVPIPQSGNLSSWAEQGVLMLNATLTVVKSKPMSHAGRGWETFTDSVVRVLCEKEEPVIFVLWGSHAGAKCLPILNGSSKKGFHPVLTCPHPSPFSAHRGFLGSGHFSKINSLLKERGLSPIDWRL